MTPILILASAFTSGVNASLSAFLLGAGRPWWALVNIAVSLGVMATAARRARREGWAR